MWMWMWMLFEAVWVCCSCGVREGAPRPSPCSYVHMGSLTYNNIGDAGARDLGAALQVNTTLTELT
jgi:hypothetical protein